jgi:hypothetical protein
MTLVIIISAGDEMRQHRWVGRTFVAVVALAGAPPAGATPTATPEPVTATDCEEHQAWVEGDAAAVAAELPDGYRPVMHDGKPLLFARAQRCAALDAGGRTAPATTASWGVVVETPDGTGCGSGLPHAGAIKGDVPGACNWYPLAFLTDDARVVDWLRQRTPDFPATRVDGLVFQPGEPGADGRAPFHFETASPTSPFSIDDVGSLRPGTISLRGGYWSDVAQGTVKMAVSTDDLSGGQNEAILRAAPGSRLARLMGGVERPSVAPQSGFGVLRIGHGVLRKQLLGPALPGERIDTFAGSCSTKGDVTFSPPATNDQAPTVYAYDAAGTCSGTLNGRELSDAPVALAQSGRADASCRQAMTFPPGNGTLTFPDGTALPYTIDFTAKGTEVDGTLYGTRSGQAPGHATFLTDRTSPQVVTDCGGDGASVVPMDLSFETTGPLVSTREAAGRRAAPAKPGARRALRLSVSPRTARSGRRTRFVVRVLGADGRTVPGATVRFSGRRVRAARGTIVLRFARPGRRVVRATKPGFRPARAVVRVV